MRFGILGPLEVLDDDGSVVPVGGPKPRALLVRLLLEAGHVVPVERLGSESPNALQAQVSRLRKVLPVEFAAGGYRIAVDAEDVDAHRFNRLAREGRQRLAAGDGRGAAVVLREALALWRGAALADLAGGAQAVSLEEARLAAVEDLVEAELGLAEGAPIGPLRGLVAEHPFRERLRAQLMRALHAAGRGAEALEVFDEGRRLLAEELGADPSPELSAVHLRLLRSEPATPARRLPPAPITRLVGRGAELDRLAEARDARLITLVGPGGAGKTRLAVEAARRDSRDACFADLSAVGDGALVPHAVAAALGLRGGGLAPSAAADPVPLIAGALAGSRLLLVLDNCEQALDAAAELARALLAACPGLAVLATSREPLGLTGEVLVPVGPLPADPAAALFAERAAAVRPGFTVDAGNAAVVAGICSLVDGLPLAIELAAARLRQLDAGELAARLSQHEHFVLLSRGDRTAADRHRTLHAVVDWSWQLLSDEERRAAARLSVFAGGATRPAALAVCGVDEAVLADLVDRSLLVAGDGRYRMLETILLFCRDRLDPQERERLQRAHAEYFLALARDADPHLRRAEQLSWLATLAADHENLMAALRRSARADRPTAMRLIAALAAYWWLAGRRREVAPIAATLLDGPIEGLEEEYVSCVVHAESLASPAHRRRAGEVIAALDRPLRHPFGAAVWGMARVPGAGPDPSPVLLAGDPWNRALQDLGAALLAVLGGHPDEAGLLDVLARFRALGERWGIAQGLDWLARLASWRGDHALAHERWAAALTTLDELGAVQEAADVLCHRGSDHIRQGDLTAAEADFRRAGGLPPDEQGHRGDLPGDAAHVRPGGPPAAELGLAEVARHRGDLPGDAAHVRHGGPPAAELGPAEVARHRGDLPGDAAHVRPGGPPAAELGLAEVARHRGDLSAAAVHLRRAIGETRPGDPGTMYIRASILTARARLAEAEGRIADAARLHEEAWSAAQLAPLASSLAEVLEGRAGHAVLTGAAAEAARLLGRAAALRGTAVASDPDVARTAAAATGALGPDGFAAAYAEGLTALR